MAPIFATGRFSFAGNTSVSVNTSPQYCITSYGQKLTLTHIGTWGTMIHKIFHVSFPSVTDISNYFTNNGEIRISFDIIGSVDNDQNADWKQLFNNVGTVFFSNSTTSKSGTRGTGSNSYPTIAATPTLIFSASGSSAYSGDTVTIYVTKLTNTTLAFDVYFYEATDGVGVYDEATSGEIKIFVDEKKICSYTSPAYTIAADIGPLTNSTVLAADAMTGDMFGIGIGASSDGKIIAIGASGRDATVSNPKGGGVYTYEWNGTEFVQVGDVLTVADYTNFGYKVALNSDGSVMVVTAMLTATYTNQGGVYTFDRVGSAWVQRGSVLLSFEPGANHAFGIGLDLSDDGNVMAVGCYQGINPIHSFGGWAQIYDRSGNTWVRRGNKIYDTTGSTQANQFGASVSLNGNATVLSVGLPQYEVSTIFAGMGRVHIYDISGSVVTFRNIVQTISATIEPAVQNDYFGTGLDLSADGNVLFVSSYGRDIAGVQNAGMIYIFDRNGSSWTFRNTYNLADYAADDYLGICVRTAGNTGMLFVSSPSWEGSITNQGAVFLRISP